MIKGYGMTDASLGQQILFITHTLAKVIKKGGGIFKKNFGENTKNVG